MEKTTKMTFSSGSGEGEPHSNSGIIGSVLKIGDFITLRYSDQGWLSAEGICFDDINLSNDLSTFENCLWEIHVQNQYTALKEYEEVLFSTISDDDEDNVGASVGASANASANASAPIDGKSEIKDIKEMTHRRSMVEKSNVTEELLTQLHRAATNEGHLNKKLMNLKIGKSVLFGDIIQLRHVKSKKFLTVCSGALAKQERENLRIRLDSYGDVRSWLEIMPKSKGDKEGQQISVNSEIILRVHGRTSEYLHCAKRIIETENLEVNCSLENSPWILSSYQDAFLSRSAKILAGQVVCLQEVDSSAYLAPVSDEGEGKVGVGVTAEGSVNYNTTIPVSLTSSNLIGSSNTVVGTHLLWILENSSADKGGVIGQSSGTNNSTITLKHLNTGMYLKIDPQAKSGTQSISLQSGHTDTVEFDITSPDANDGLHDGAMIQLSSQGVWIFTPLQPTQTQQKIKNSSIHNKVNRTSSLMASVSFEEVDAPVIPFSCSGTSEKGKASTFTIRNTLHLRFGPDLFLGVEAAKILKNFVHLGRIQSSPAASSQGSAGFTMQIKTVLAVLDLIFQFLSEDLLSASTSSSTSFGDSTADPEKIDIFQMIETRQIMMREQGVLTAVVELIELCGDDLVVALLSQEKCVTPSIHSSLSQSKISMKNLISQNSIGRRSPFQSNRRLLSREERSSPKRSPSKKLLASTLSMEARRDISRNVSQERIGTRRNHGILRARTSRSNFGDILSDLDSDQFSESLDNFPITGTGGGVGGAAGGEGGFYHSNQSKRTLAHDLSTSSFKTLFAIIHDNHSNQMSIADKFPILLNQVKDQELAVACVQEMLRDNIQMLETKVREREIGIFLHLLQESEMNVTLLNLLRSTCSCPEGVDSTQRMVSTSLFAPFIPKNLHNINERQTTTNPLPGVISPSSPMPTPTEVATTIGTKTKAEGVGVGVEGEGEGATTVNTSTPSEEKRLSVESLVRRPHRLKPVLTPLRVSISSLPLNSFTSIMMSPLNRNILIMISLNEKHRIKTVHWTHNPLYTVEGEMQREVLGHHLVTDGLPRLSISWEVGEEQTMSMMHLFGFSKEVPYEQLCQTTSLSLSQQKSAPESIGKFLGGLTNSKGKRSSIISGDTNATKRNSIIGKSRGKTTLKKKHNVKSITEYKIQVGDYFCCQLFLMADLCLDRNYLSMKYVETKYSFELLLTILKHPESTPKIKAPVCKLIRCLYVDRDPQIEIKYPRLIRTLMSESSANICSSPNKIQFYLLQEVISDFLHNEFDIYHCDELSSELLDLLLSLMKFGFFSLESQLHDILVPLGRLLDKHRIGSETPTIAIAPNKSFESNNIDDHSPPSNISPESVPEESSNFSWGISAWFWKSNQEVATRRRSSIQPFPIKDEDDLNSLRKPEEVGGDISKLSPPQEEDDENFMSFFLFSSTTRSQHRKLCRQFLDYTESTTHIVVILMLVLLSTSIAILNVASKNIRDEETQILILVDLSISFIFICELLARLYTNQIVNGEIISFVSNRYKLLDVIVVVLDISLLSYGTASMSNSVHDISRFAKTLRILRVLRLIRLVRAARILRRISVKKTDHLVYTPPVRYSTITEHETRSLTAILKILLIVYDRMQDQKLGDLIQKYSHWFDESFQVDSVNPKVIYKLLCEESKVAFPPKFGEMLLDILMYSEPNLVQEALRLLMSYESQEGLFIVTARKVQIISSIHLEGLYKNIVEHLQYLKTQAESIELWGGLKTAADHEIAKSVKDTLHQIADSIRKKVDGRKLEIDPENPVDEEVQQLLFNLDAFSVFMLLQKEILSNGTVVVDETIKELIRACNDCILLFVQANENNQIVAYEQMNWFLARIDDDLYSSLVARAIITSNRNLIKQCPRAYVLQLIQMIVTQSQRSEYLNLLVGMTDVSDEGDTGIISLRSEISRYVTNQEKLKFLIQWCKGSKSPEYELRRRAMLEYVVMASPLLDRQLSAELQYHITFLSLLAGCKLGHKLQAVYPLEDIVFAISDRTMLYNVKRALGLLLLSLVNEKADCLEGSEAIWKFFDFSLFFFQDSKEQLKTYLTKEKSPLRHQYAEWISLLLKIISNFFDDFDFKVFLEQTTFETESSFLPTQRSLLEIRATILSLCKELISFKSTNSVYLGPRLLTLFEQAVTILKKKLPHSIVGDEDSHPSDVVPLVASRSRSFRKVPSMSADSVHEAFFRRQYHWFLDEISEPKQLYYLNAVTIFQNLPSISDDLPSDIVRLEPLITKLCQHIRSRLEHHPASVILDRNSVATTLWLIETWSFMISRELPLHSNSLNNLDFLGEVPVPTHYQQVLNECGVTILCLELIGVGIDLSLQVACLRLLTLLLACNHGNESVQKTIFRHLSQNESVLFFEAAKDMIDQQMLWCQHISETVISRSDKNSNQGSMSPASSEFPEVRVLLLAIRGMCAGGFIENKNIFREQHGNSRIVNLLDHFAAYLDLISRVDNFSCLSLGITLIRTVLSLIQGPCRGNQEYFVLQTNLMASLNRILRMSPPLLEEDKERVLEDLKLGVLDVLLACIEGQSSASKGTVVMERIQVAIELNVLNLVLMPSEKMSDDDEINPSDLSVDLSPLQSKYLVFLRTIKKDISNLIFDEIVSVEVYWQHQIHEYYFRIPPIANHISKSSKNRLIEKVDLSSQDLKLKDFLRLSRDLYREALHHDNLERYEISNAWDFRGYISWFMFVACLVVNLLLIAYYRRDQDDNETLLLPENIELTILLLLIAQVIYAIWSLGVYLIVRTPVLYWSYADQYESPYFAIATVLVDPQLLWSLFYLVFSLLALLNNYLYISTCLLDFIAMNSTSRDVLNAVVYPARQLSAAIVIILIIVNIFAMAIFSSYEDSYDLDGIKNHSLWDSFRLVITYGVRYATANPLFLYFSISLFLFLSPCIHRANEGIGEFMTPNISQRMVLDMLFYFIVIVVLLNIFFGIIIDTFGKLRNLKVERESELLNKCFICGANFEEIVSQSSVADGSSMILFRSHREKTHNLWNYLYFVLHIWHQSREKDSSLEMHVRMCIEREDVTWFPSGRSLHKFHSSVSSPISSSNSGEVDGQELSSLRSEVEGLKQDLHSFIDRFEQISSIRR